MALKKCKECGKEVSSKADTCPNCGVKLKSKSIGCGGAILIIIVIGFFVSQISECQQKEVDQTRITQQAEVKKKRDQQLQNDKKDFEENINDHYNKLTAFFNDNQFDQASVQIALFKKFNKTDYKDVKSIEKVVQTSILENKVKKIPASDISGNLDIYKQLLALNPSIAKYKNKVNHYTSKYDSYLKDKKDRDWKASSKLELLAHSWSVKHGYAQYEGQVKNISNIKLKNVQAVVIWSDKNGNMITSSSALIEYNPILPGQTSPFKVMKSQNPAMQSASIEFSYLMGGKIQTYWRK